MVMLVQEKWLRAENFLQKCLTVCAKHQSTGQWDHHPVTSASNGQYWSAGQSLHWKRKGFVEVWLHTVG